MKTGYILFVAVLICVIVVDARPTAMVVVQDKATSFGTVKLLDLATGKYVREQKASVQFEMPLVETTVNPVTRHMYLVTYPQALNGAVAIYEFNQTLEIINEWKPSYGVFDLQFSVKEES